MKRREFLGTSGAAVIAAVIPSSPLARQPSSPPYSRLARVGLELYAVRAAMKADPEGTLAKVKAMGYDDVELLWSFDNFGRTPAQVHATLTQLGLNAPSAHIAPEALLKDWDKSLDTARYLGHRYLIVPSLPAETNRSLDAWLKWADIFNTAGAAAKKAGVSLAFHNEPDHMQPIGGKIPYDAFVARTDPKLVHLQLDIGNMTMGGGDPLAYAKKHGARYVSLHVKDITPDRKSDTELGKGTVNIKAILAAIPDVRSKPCYVEQESPSDELAAARQNVQYLRALDF